MSYHPRNSNFEERKRQARNKILLIILILIITLIILATTVAQKTLFFIAEPVWKVKNSVLDFNKNHFDFFRSKNSLIAENLELKNQLFVNANLKSLNDILQVENENLKDLLGRKSLNNNTTLASVLVKPPQTPYDVLIIDIGSDQNVKVGAKVLANANTYLGEITEVNPSSSKVTLYSSPGEKRSVVLGSNLVTVEAVGIGGGNFNIFAPREIEVKENDVIIIPSITPNIFGIVEKVNFKDKDSFQTVLFKSPVNISELTWVEVIL